MAKLVRATQYSVAVDSCTSQRNVVFSPVLSVSLGILSSSEPTYTVPPSLPPSPFSSFRLPDGTRAGAYPNTTRQQKQRRGGVSAPPPFRPARVNVPNFFCQLKSRCKELSAVIIFLFWVPKLEVAAVTLDPNTVHRRKLACARHPVEQ